jgi:hypothetical protein
MRNGAAVSHEGSRWTMPAAIMHSVGTDGEIISAVDSVTEEWLQLRKYSVNVSKWQ